MTLAVVMDKSRRGVKRHCTACSAPFYDMLRSPIQCPKCGALYKEGAANSARRLKSSPTRARFSKGRPPPVIEAVQPKPVEADESAEPAEDREDGEDTILDAEEDEE